MSVFLRTGYFMVDPTTSKDERSGELLDDNAVAEPTHLREQRGQEGIVLGHSELLPVVACNECIDAGKLELDLELRLDVHSADERVARRAGAVPYL